MIQERLEELKKTLPDSVQVVAVSKTKPNSDIIEAYQAGHRVFGENKVQELTDKYEQLPKDISWHFIGHLQTNKVKYIAPFVSLIHSLDSLKLAKEVNKRGKQNDRKIDCLLQVHIADEETKFGIPADEVTSFLSSDTLKAYTHVRITGLMGMATNTEDKTQVANEFKSLKRLFDSIQQNASTYFEEPDAFRVLSMGMSGDYPLAVEAGSNMIRVGSSIFGARNYTN
jgi:pyridoxal phosphate enzyme (YggS family)